MINEPLDAEEVVPAALGDAADDTPLGRRCLTCIPADDTRPDRRCLTCIQSDGTPLDRRCHFRQIRHHTLFLARPCAQYRRRRSARWKVLVAPPQLRSHLHIKHSTDT